MKRIFTKKFWQITKAKLRIIKFRFFYSASNTLKVIIIFFIVLPIVLLLIYLPLWFFEFIANTYQSNIPDFIKMEENPEWVKMDLQKRRKFVELINTWK